MQKQIDIEAIALQFMENNRIEGVSNTRNIAWKPFFHLFPELGIKCSSMPPLARPCRDGARPVSTNENKK
jgi:hypothetical protein